MQKQKPESIEGRWDILYRDYPEVYDEFANVSKVPSLDLIEKFHLEDKVIADLGSGTGESTFQYAKLVKEVIGIEIAKPMIEIAEKLAKEKKIENVELILGDAGKIPLDDNAVDATVAATLAPNYPEAFKDIDREATRITKNGGIIVFLNIAPEWYGGELDKIIGHDDDYGRTVDKILSDRGYDFEDVIQNQEYGSLDKIIRTYGFIFGKKAIEYLKKHNKTNIRWKSRIRFKKVEK